MNGPLGLTAAVVVPASGGESIAVAHLGTDDVLIETELIGPFQDALDPSLTIDPENRVTVHFFAVGGGTSEQRALRISATGNVGRLVTYDGPATAGFATAPDGEFVALGGWRAFLRATFVLTHPPTFDFGTSLAPLCD